MTNVVTAQDLLQDAIRHLQTGQTGEAAALSIHIIVFFPDWAEGWRVQGMALRHAGDAVGGVRAIGRALCLDPALAHGQSNLESMLGHIETEARIHVQNGHFAAAARLFRAVVSVVPGHDNAHRNLRTLARLARDHAQALARQGRAEDAIGVCETMLGSVPEDAELQVTAGTLARQSGQIDRARRHLCRGIVRHPDHGPLCSELGQLLAQDGRHREAASLEERAARLHPDDANACLRQGFHWKAAGRLPHAAAAFAEAARRAPDNPVMWFNLGLTQAELGQWELAAAAFRRFLQTRPPGNAGTLQSLYAEEVVAQQSFQALFRMQQGQWWLARGYTAEAQGEFQAALTFDGACVGAQRGLTNMEQVRKHSEDVMQAPNDGMGCPSGDLMLREDALQTGLTRAAVPGATPTSGTAHRPRWAIVPGLMRDLPAFLGIFQHLVSLRAQGLLDQIVVSTWIGQVSGNPELRRLLESQDIIVTESVEPRPNPSGHNLHQMKAVLAALDLCPDDAFVIKLRTDKLDFHVPENASLLVTMLTGAQDLSILDQEWPRVFQQRVSVSGGMLHRLFNHADQLFGGLRGDLVRLVNFDFRYVEIFQNLRTEQWWFSRPFVDKMPIFQDYFRSAPSLPYDRIEARLFLEQALKNDFFLEALVSYIAVLHRYYRVGWLRADSPLYDMAADLLKGVTYSDWFFRVLGPLGQQPFQGIIATPSFQNDAWIAPFLNGGLRIDALGERVLDAYERVRDPSYHRNYRLDADRHRGMREAFAALTPPL